ncbi:hypothetical protein N665_0385s0015 [Sinapis alba]|nr:hypothetical protein N665_0385s0015 [Sinapis alba]
MEWNKTLGMIVIVTVSTLVTILTPIESMPLHVFPPSNPPFESESLSPSPRQDATTPIIIAANPSTEIDMDSPSPSSESPADSLSDSLSSVVPNLLKQPLLSPEIKSICDQTDSPLLCESSISPLLTTLLKPDASSVLVLAIQASITATKAVMSTVNRVAGADCQELYDAAVSNLEDAVNAVKEGDVASVNSNLSAAMTDYGTCNDGFEEAGEVNPLVDVADKLTKMVSNCLAISTLIK